MSWTIIRLVLFSLLLKKKMPSKKGRWNTFVELVRVSLSFCKFSGMQNSSPFCFAATVLLKEHWPQVSTPYGK